MTIKRANRRRASRLLARKRLVGVTRGWLAGALLYALASVPVATQAAAAPGPGDIPARDAASETAIKISSGFTVAAVGDIIEPQPLLRSDGAFAGLVDHIRQADVGFANMESSLVDFRTYQGAVAGTLAPLEVGEAVKAMGIRLMNHANNHAFDGGVAAMNSTDEALDRLGIVHAGTGRNLQEARAARFLETPKGRVGLVGMYALDDSSNYGPSYARTEASYRNGNLGGAPGVNPLHLVAYHIVDAGRLASLKAIAAEAYGPAAAEGAAVGRGEPARFKFFDEWFQAGQEAGSLHYEMNPADERNILESIRNGKIYADFLVATIHAHQTTHFWPVGTGGPWESGAPGQTKEAPDHVAADFLVKLAHDCIDNGADLFVAHGVHALGGIEIYKGKPVFYGVSHFVFQFGLQFGSGYDPLANERQLSGLENEAAQETVLTTTRFDGGKLQEVRLYPVDLGGPRRPLSQMGIPLTPAPEVAQRILRHLQEYSRPFGTQIAIEGNVGIIRPGGGSSVQTPGK